MASNAASRQNNVPFHGGNSRYNLNGQTARQTLQAKGWIFNDGGLEDTSAPNMLPGINITDPITINDEFEEFPTHYDIYGFGGYHCVENITERNSISFERRKEGMIVFTSQDSKNWMLSGSLANPNWVEVGLEKSYPDLFLNKFNQTITGSKNFIQRPTVSGAAFALTEDPENFVSIDSLNIGGIEFTPQIIPYINFDETPRINNISTALNPEVSPSLFTCSHSFYNPNRNGQTSFCNNLTNLPPSLSDLDREFVFPFPATIIGATVTVNMSQTGVGTNLGYISILDKTTKIHYKLVDNIFYNFTRQSFSGSNLKIDLEANRKYAIRIETPSFESPPFAVRHQINLLLVNRANKCLSAEPPKPLCPINNATYDTLATLNNSGCIVNYLCTPRLPAYIPPDIIISDYLLKQQIYPNQQASNYGSSIGMSEDNSVIVVGASNDPENNVQGFNAGAVFIYTGSKENGWIFKQKLLGDNLAGAFYPSQFQPPGHYYGESLGQSVSVNYDGSVIFAGARVNSTLSNSYGAGKIYTGSKNNGWQLKQIIVPPLIENAISYIAWFGTSNAISSGGNILALGGPQYYLTGTLSSGLNARIQGAVALYTGDTENGWNFKQMITGNSIRRSGFANAIRAGWSIDMNSDGNVIVVGCPTDMSEVINGFGNGSILILTGNAINGWNLKQHIFDNSPSISGFQRAYFGGSVCISNNNIIAVGAPAKLNSTNTAAVGGIYIYSGTPETNWSLRQSINGSIQNSRFGESVYIDKTSGNSIIVGAPSSAGGIVNLYDRKASSNWVLRQNFIGNLLTQEPLFYGRSTWISKNSDILLYTSPFESVGVGSLVIYTGKF
jgi:hypothetical protein